MADDDAFVVDSIRLASGDDDDCDVGRVAVPHARCARTLSPPQKRAVSSTKKEEEEFIQTKKKQTERNYSFFLLLFLSCRGSTATGARFIRRDELLLATPRCFTIMKVH